MIGRQSPAPRRGLALFLFLALSSLLAVVPPARGAETVVNFDNLSVGAPVTDQYEALGVKLGRSSEVGFGQQPSGDCGSPEVASGGAAAVSPPNYATLANCSAPKAAPSYFSGTVGALLGTPRGALSVDVRDLTVGTPGEEVKLIAYDGTGREVASAHALATSGAWQHITLVLGGEKSISYFSIATTEPRTDPASVQTIAIDNLGFEAAGEEPGGGKGGGKEKGGGSEAGGGTGGGGAGGSGGSGAGSSPGNPTGGPPAPPTATLALASANPGPGQALTLSGAGSQGGGGRIISYDWDLNGDGKTDTSTGTNPIAHVILPPGAHTIGLTVTSSTGQSSSTKLGVAIPARVTLPPPADGGEGPCEPTLTVGDAQLIAECIQKLPGGGYAIATKQLAVNGMDLVPQGGGYGVFKIQTVKDYAIAGAETKLSGSAVSIELLNTPIGDVVLGGRDLESEPIALEVHSGLNDLKVPLVHGVRAHTAGNEVTSKTLLMAVGVGHACTGAESKKAGCCPPSHENTACATLPGNFPLVGQVDIYINNKGQALIDVQVGLELKGIFEATGALEIEAEPTGVNLNTLKFTVPEAGLEGIFTVKEASFVYYFPGAPEESKRDTWQAKGKIVFGPLGEPALEGELAFKKGRFHSASLSFLAPPPGVPLYAGVYLNKLGASVGVEPFAFGGNIGASIASQLELTLAFKYREPEGEELGFFGGEGQLQLSNNPIASLAADVYSDGYIDAQLKINLKLPFGGSPVVSVGGGLGFWDEPKSGLWQAEGNVYLKLWEISGEVAGLVNNKYIAGCLNLNTFGYSWGLQGRYRIEDGNVSGGGYGNSNCADQLKEYKQTPLVKHSGGFVGGESLAFAGTRGLGWPGGPDAAGLPGGASAGTASGASSGEAFTLPSGTLGEELRVSSTAGTPVVTLTSPGGQSYTTPAAGGRPIGDDGHFLSAILPDRDQVMVLLRHPQGGTWHVQSAPGAPAIDKIENAEDVPPATVHVHVRHGHGHDWVLAYGIAHYLAGSKVRFVERGRDSTHVLGVASSARGTLRFTPQDALGRARRVEAYLLDGEGAPVRMLLAGHYTAPSALRGGRVRGLRILRRGTSALITWHGSVGARLYKVRVRGSDGRLQTLWRKPDARSVTLPNVLPFERFTATVSAAGGPNLLPGPIAKVTLAPERLTRRHPPARRHQRITR
jgi:PKD repeat protein